MPFEGRRAERELILVTREVDDTAPPAIGPLGARRFGLHDLLGAGAELVPLFTSVAGDVRALIDVPPISPSSDGPELRRYVQVVGADDDLETRRRPGAGIRHGRGRVRQAGSRATDRSGRAYGRAGRRGS
jgi:hypothetical protein